MSDKSTEPNDAQALTDEAEAMLAREMEEFRKVLSGYAKLVTEHPEVMESLRENLAFAAKYIVSNRPEFVEDYRDVSKSLDKFLQEFADGTLDPQEFILDEDKNEQDSSS